MDEARFLAEAALEVEGQRSTWETASILLILGEVAFRQDRPQDALDYLEESHRLAPKSYTATLIVRSLFKAGEWEAGARADRSDRQSSGVSQPTERGGDRPRERALS